MKKLLALLPLLLLFAIPHRAQAQLLANCQNTPTVIPCAGSGPSATGTGDQLVTVGVKYNTDFLWLSPLWALPANSVPCNSTSGAGAFGACTEGSGIVINAGVISSTGGGGGGTPGGASGQIQYNAGSVFGGFTMGGDATLNPVTGIITVTNTNGVPFVASATTNTTNASNISSGTLGAARLPAALSSSTSVNGTTIAPTAGTAPGSTGAFTSNDCVKIGTVSPLQIADAGAACGSGGGSGTVTTTGSPASGELAKFSGATSIVNGNLSGDATTTNTLAVTVNGARTLFTAVSSSTPLTATESAVVVTSGTGPITLPTAVSEVHTYCVNVGASNTSTVSIATTSSQTIQGVAAPASLSGEGNGVCFNSDNSGWWY